MEEADESNFRSFVELPEDSRNQVQQKEKNLEDQTKLERLRKGVIGADAPFAGPFGERQLVYADWTASGRAYEPIENYVRDKVYTFYANTHTSTSISGLQSTCFRAEARQIIQQSVNANTRTDVVLFTGSGATAAVNKLVNVLGLKIQLPSSIEINLRPVVFVGPFEHHSNILPWRESNADVVNVRENPNGTGIDQAHLIDMLSLYKDRPLLIGAFTAASNVTGVMEDVDKVSSILHRHGALAVWDYAAAGPYATIDMNPVLPGDHPDRAFVHKDAVFISPHKFLGGVNTPGILVAKKRLFQNAVPADLSTGGGTVYFVKEDSHRYVSNRVEREEGGTPDVVGAIRAGLAFQLKQTVGVSLIESVEERWVGKIRARLGSHPAIALLGPSGSNQVEQATKQLPIASFLIRHGETFFLHYNFVSALLNDLYGIQTRGGCACAGPYVQRLLGMERHLIEQIELELVRDPKHCEYLRPGFTRLSLSYFASEDEVDFILQAVVDIAENGWKLLPYYRFNTRTGEWKHRSRFTKFPGRLWLEDATLLPATDQEKEASLHQTVPINFKTVLETAVTTMNDVAALRKENLGDQANLLSESAAVLRWFLLPSEALDEIKLGNKAQHSIPASAESKTTLPANISAGPADKVIDPHLYWKMLKTSGALEDSMEVGSDDARTSDFKRSIDEENTSVEADQTEPNGASPNKRTKVEVDDVICKDNTCFVRRTKDKFPLRDASVIRQDSAQIITVDKSKDLLGSTSTLDGISATNNPFPVESASMIGHWEMLGAKLFPKPPKNILRFVGKAIAEWDMIKDGDRLLLGLSGGKDSLALLHVLLHLQKKAPVRFEIAACTIDPMTEAFDPSPLIPYMKALGVTYHYVKDPIFDRAKSGSLQGTSICSFCSRMKRGALYSCARENGYNTLVLAQHLDDCAETLVMGMFHNGHMRSMMANYEEKKGDIRVIRPLIYTREKDTKEFAYAAKLPVINENCPACFEAPQERKRVKKLLAKEEATTPSIFNSLRRAIVPLMDPEILAVLEKGFSDREQKGKRPIEKNDQGRAKKKNKQNGVNKPSNTQSVQPVDSGSTDIDPVNSNAE